MEKMPQILELSMKAGIGDEDSKKEAQKVLDEFNCKPTELPLIFVSDPAILGLGVKPGDMIKITRKSGTAGESIYYRYVGEI